MNRLAGKVAVITGAGSGIGRASAKMFVAEGAQVVVAEIDEALGEASARDAGPGARFMRTDVTDEDSVKQMVQQAKQAFGRVDVLLNCAGGSLREDKPVTEVDLSVWDHTIDLDMKGPFLCCRHVIPLMVEQGKGSVVNFSSVVALRGNHIAHVYVMATGALISFTQALAGDPSKPGLYIVMVKWLPGGMSHPHFHPNDRFITVLKGTWWVGTGTKFDPDSTVPMPAGTFVTHFGKQVHYDGAKDEEAVLLITGEGPATSTAAEEK